MLSTATLATPLPRGWAQILDKTERDVDLALQAAAEREQRLDALPSLHPLDGPHQITLQRLKHWSERLRHLESRARQAEQEAAQLEAQLAADETVARAWISEADALRQRLADWEESKC